MKTLIDIPRFVWGKVRDFATVNEITASSAVEKLLIQALNSNGYVLAEIEAVEGLRKVTNKQIFSSLEENKI
jgi:hypothetical protein